MTNRSMRNTAVLAAFLSGCSTMMVEVAAGRLVSRDLGNSVYTWTSIIGIVLGGLSLGNFAGGTLADKFPARKRLLATCFMLAGLLVAIIPALNGVIGKWQFLWSLSWPARIFGHAFSVFFLPSVLLGLIGPVTAKIMIDSVPPAESGRSIGLVYAAGAVGSIFGTFLCGFVLIAQMGLPRLFLCVAGLLLVVSILLALGSGRATAASVVSLLCVAAAYPPLSRDHFLSEEGVIHRAESRYSHITVVAAPSNPNHRSLYLDRLKHTEIDLRRPQDLEYPYSWIFEATVNLRAGEAPKPVSTLVLGGGGFAVPTYLEATRPGSQVDTVEIDPAVLATARDYFGFKSSDRSRAHIVDARVFLARERAVGSNKWQFVLHDLFNDYSLPAHLTTRETLQAIKDVMTPDGVLMMNMIDSLDHGRFLPSILLTYRAVFSNVAAVSCSQDGDNRDTFVVMGSDQPLPMTGIAAEIGRRHTFYGRVLAGPMIDDLVRREGACVLTDDYAPVDNMLATVISRDLGGKLERLFSIGISKGNDGDLQGAAAAFQEATRICPGSEAAHYNLGLAYQKLSQLADAGNCFDNAIRIKPDHVDARKARASLLAQVGQMDAAIVDWVEILRINPDLPDVQDNIAIAYAMRGQFEVAQHHWIASLEHEPGRSKTWHNLGMSYAQARDGVAAALCLGMAARAEPSNALFQQHASESRAAVLAAGYPAKDMETLLALSPERLLQDLRARKGS